MGVDAAQSATYRSFGMNLRMTLPLVLLGLAPGLSARADVSLPRENVSVTAANVVVEAGKTHILLEDLVLTGADVLEVKGTREQPCTIIGNNHRIRTDGKW